MNRLRQLWLEVGSSFWFVPSLIVLASIGLALGLVALDGLLPASFVEAWPRVFGAGAAGSRGLLETIAGSMITVAGVVFSITLVALSLTSSQYSPRVLRNFMRSGVNQVVLGVFVGIFAYCLVVLRTIRAGDDSPFVPSLAVLGALLLGFVGIGVLVFFIHHIARSIQAVEILAVVHDETIRAVDRQYPDRLQPGDEDEPRVPGVAEAGRSWHPILGLHTGYVQRVDLDLLQSVAREGSSVVRMEVHVGEFAIEGMPLACWLGTRRPDETVVHAVRRAYTIGHQRTVQEDAAFGIRQLVDVGLKGLSPGINDTTTASMSVDYLTAILARLCTRRLATSAVTGDGQVCVLSSGPSFATLVEHAYDQIRHNAEGNVAVLERLLKGLENLAEQTRSAARRAVLLRHASAVAENIERTIEAPMDRQDLMRRSSRVIARLRG